MHSSVKATVKGRLMFPLRCLLEMSRCHGSTITIWFWARIDRIIHNVPIWSVFVLVGDLVFVDKLFFNWKTHFLSHWLMVRRVIRSNLFLIRIWSFPHFNPTKAPINRHLLRLHFFYTNSLESWPRPVHNINHKISATRATKQIFVQQFLWKIPITLQLRLFQFVLFFVVIAKCNSLQMQCWWFALPPPLNAHFGTWTISNLLTIIIVIYSANGTRIRVISTVAN